MTNITFDFLEAAKGGSSRRRPEAKRQAPSRRRPGRSARAAEQAQAEAKRQADRLKEEQAGRRPEGLEQESKGWPPREAQKAKEQQELEEEARRQRPSWRSESNKGCGNSVPPPPTPLAAALPDNPSSRINFTPPGYTLGEVQIFKEKTEGWNTMAICW